jgi:hypothetical protein
MARTVRHPRSARPMSRGCARSGPCVYSPAARRAVLLSWPARLDSHEHVEAVVDVVCRRAGAAIAPCRELIAHVVGERLGVARDEAIAARHLEARQRLTTGCGLGEHVVGEVELVEELLSLGRALGDQAVCGVGAIDGRAAEAVHDAHQISLGRPLVADTPALHCAVTGTLPHEAPLEAALVVVLRQLPRAIGALSRHEAVLVEAQRALAPARADQHLRARTAAVARGVEAAVVLEKPSSRGVDHTKRTRCARPSASHDARQPVSTAAASSLVSSPIRLSGPELEGACASRRGRTVLCQQKASIRP